MDIMLYTGEVQSGPVALEAVREMVRLGSVASDTLAWTAGMDGWIPVGELLAAHPEPPPCAEPPPIPQAQSRPHPHAHALTHSQAQGNAGRFPSVLGVAQPERSFTSLLPDAFVYPFRGNGKYLIIAGGVFFLIMDVVSTFGGIFSIPLAVFSAGYLFACMQSLITASAMGESDMPAWPDFTDFYQDAVLPFIHYLVTAVVCLGPLQLFLAALAMRSVEDAPGGLSQLVVPLGVLALAGLVYAPMAVLAVAMADSLSGLNPLLVLPSILKVGANYLITCVMLGLLLGLGVLIEDLLQAVIAVPVLPKVIHGFVSLYLLVVEMRLLGNLYRANRSKLGWV